MTGSPDGDDDSRGKYGGLTVDLELGHAPTSHGDASSTDPGIGGGGFPIWQGTSVFGGGGGGGGFVQKTFSNTDLTPGATMTISVGGPTARTYLDANAAGGLGSPGVVIVYWR